MYHQSQWRTYDRRESKEAAKRILMNRETIERADVISTRLELECIKHNSTSVIPKQYSKREVTENTVFFFKKKKCKWSHLTLFPSVWKESGFDPSFMNFIFESKKISFSPCTFKPTFSNTQPISARHYHTYSVNIHKPPNRGNLPRNGKNYAQVWGPEFLKATKFLISKKEKKDLKEGKGYMLVGVWERIFDSNRGKESE